ncbi:hypothetical protein ACJX0J_030119 [Zea mays]
MYMIITFSYFSDMGIILFTLILLVSLIIVEPLYTIYILNFEACLPRLLCLVGSVMLILNGYVFFASKFNFANKCFFLATTVIDDMLLLLLHAPQERDSCAHFLIFLEGLAKPVWTPPTPATESRMHNVFFSQINYFIAIFSHKINPEINNLSFIF